MLTSAIGSMNFPGQVHQVVYAQPGHGAANPDKQSDQAQELGEEPDVGRHPGQYRKRGVPPSQEQSDRQAADGKKADIFTQEEERELEPGILRVIAGDDFGFTLGEVEGSAVGFGGGGDQE